MIPGSHNPCVLGSAKPCVYKISSWTLRNGPLRSYLQGSPRSYHINLATLESGHKNGLSVNMYVVAAFTLTKHAILQQADIPPGRLHMHSKQEEGHRKITYKEEALYEGWYIVVYICSAGT